MKIKLFKICIIIMSHIIFIFDILRPLTLYGKPEVNFFSLTILVAFIILLIIFRKNIKVTNNILNVNILLLIPSILMCFLYDIGETSYTNDIDNYMKFDTSEVMNDAQFFPKEINGEVEWYYYYYDIFMTSDTSSYEISLKLLYDDVSWEQVKQEMNEEFSNKELIVKEGIYSIIIYKQFEENDFDFIRRGKAQFIIINEEEKSIIYESINIRDKVFKNKLYYYEKNLFLY